MAPIVAIEDIFGKYAILTLDDGSGATISVKIKRIPTTATEVASVVDRPSNTTIPNVNVFSEIGKFNVEIDGRNIDTGTVVRAKCTITTFRGINQLDLQRASIIDTTKKEAMAWREVAQWKRKVLSKPWVLFDRDLRRLEAEEVERKKRDADKKLHRERRAKKYLYRKLEEDQKYEKSRVEEETVMNDGALL